jgi:cell division protein FtsI/penicillin-binding protein 2
MKAEDIQVRRGIIFDRRGRELALNLELESLYCDPETLSIDNEDMKAFTDSKNQNYPCQDS